MCFSSGGSPSIPAPAPAPVKEKTTASRATASRDVGVEGQQETNKRVSSTLLTGPQGVTEEATTRRKTLLGQ